VKTYVAYFVFAVEMWTIICFL